MILFKKSDALSAYLQAARKAGKTVGFVPTMGALHTGHITLVAAARQPNQLAVASIFVNPAQFNDKKDFDKYPVTIEKDIDLLVQAGCDVLFLPAVDEIYPRGHQEEEKHYSLGYLETVLEGQYRPGHFQGVCKVMDRLLSIVRPDQLYMGQKDYQQCMVVKRLLQIMQMPASFHTCPTLREPDGLAMSSRNTRLNPEERKHAAGIFLSLNHLRRQLVAGPLSSLLAAGMDLLVQHNFKVDYIAIADAGTLEILEEWDGSRKVVGLIAAFQHEVRLIDNLLLN